MSKFEISMLVIFTASVYVLGVFFIFNLLDKLEDEKLLTIGDNNEGVYIFGTFVWPLTIILLPFIFLFKYFTNKITNAIVWVVKEIKKPRDNV